MKGPLLAALALLTPAGTRALEVSLEENRAQRGSVGYVDMQRVFKLYPETQRAKASFSEILRQAEEGVNLKKSELISLRAEIAKLNMERELLLRTPILVEPEAAGSAPVPVSTAAAGGKTPLIINIPGVTSQPVVVETPAAPAPAPDAPKLPPTQAELAARRGARHKELESLLADKIAELGRRETAFKDYQARAEKNLLDLESRRSEMLLGKIYEAVREVARESSVSVVVDKTQILFGQNTVDLTEKVLKKLEGPKP